MDNHIIEFKHNDFDFNSLEEEVLVDQKCRSLLQGFYTHLIKTGLSPEKASEAAYRADYYVRDYVVDFARQNVVRPLKGIVRKFAASWYITHTLDPEPDLLLNHLLAIEMFYRYLHHIHLVSAEEVQMVEDEVSDKEYYRNRLISFANITGDGFVAWDMECPCHENVNKD